MKCTFICAVSAVPHVSVLWLVCVDPPSMRYRILSSFPHRAHRSFAVGGAEVGRDSVGWQRDRGLHAPVWAGTVGARGVAGGDPHLGVGAALMQLPCSLAQVGHLGKGDGRVVL